MSAETIETRLENGLREKLISECLKWDIELKRLERKWRAKKKKNLSIKLYNELVNNELVVLQKRFSLEDDYNKVFAIKECKVVVRSCQENQLETTEQRAINQNAKNVCLNKQTNYYYQQFECQHPGCDKKVASEGGLRQHKNVHAKKFQCQVCQKCFPATYSLQRHHFTHTGERPFECDWAGCGQRFKQEGTLRKHIKIMHSNEEPFHCNQEGCGRSFKFKNSLEEHLNLHTAKFQCEHCHKCFKSLAYFKIHLRTHTDERPFKCDWAGCGKRFKYKYLLKLHKIAKHSDERPFKCHKNDCEKSFKLKKVYKHHLKLHSIESTFHCEFEGCDKRFKTKWDLKQHVNYFHCDVRKFQCEFKNCQKSFKSKGDLKQHQKTHK